MGVSYGHKAILIFYTAEDGQAFAEQLPDEIPRAIIDVPLTGFIKRVELDGKIVVLDSQGYGIIALEELDYPTAPSIAISSVESRQGQETDYVEIISGDALYDGEHNVGPEDKEDWSIHALLTHFTGAQEGFGEEVEEEWGSIYMHAVESLRRGQIENYLLLNTTANEELRQRISHPLYGMDDN